MQAFSSLSKQELEQQKQQLLLQKQGVLAKKLTLDMTRGKPCSEQLDLSLGLFTVVDAGNYFSEEGVDVRNYGVLDGLKEAKAFFADYLALTPQQIIVGGASSLNLMHDVLSISMLQGTIQGPSWTSQLKDLNTLKFLCPVPGYDRHFSATDHMGIEMIAVPMNDDGPDMDKVEALVEKDASIKGIWCVPKYSNPTGVSYSDEVVSRLANMKTAADDFRIMWDDAYRVHHLGHGLDQVQCIVQACEQAGNADRAYVFASTSKISFAGAGVAVLAGSQANMDFMRKHFSQQTIGSDKINQLRHVKFFRDQKNLAVHMNRHAEILAPKFNAVLNSLRSHLSGTGLATWTEPKGGYFISLDTLPGCAKEVIALAGEMGVKLTPAGATFPYGKDTEDTNIRIAPSFPTVSEVEKASEVLCLAIKLVSVNKLLAA